MNSYTDLINYETEISHNIWCRYKMSKVCNWTYRMQIISYWLREEEKEEKFVYSWVK